MIQNIHDLSDAERSAHQKLNGGFNDFPPNWREITAKQFAQSRHFTFIPVLIEYRQMLTNPHVEMLAARLCWQYDGTGFSVVNDYWAGTIKFFAFGERTPGLVENFDSSD